MISTRLLISHKHRRAWLGWIVVAALAFHGVIPLGYMPDAAREANQPLAMMICGGHHGSGVPQTTKTGKATQDHAPCPFSVNAVFALTGADARAVILFSIVALLAAMQAFALAHRPRYGNAAPRAPPVRA